MISIIVPVYKVEKCLARCIDSILAQTYQDWELILVDDGSPDRSGEICDGYALKDARIHAVHQQNQGVSAARNHGIELAKGEYITFVDSDDYLDQDFLSSFDLEHGADLQVQGMISTYPDKDDQILLPVATHGRNTSVYEALSCADNVRFLFSPWAKLFRTSILRDHEVMYPTEICYTEDEVFVKRFLTVSTSVHFFDCAYYYYTHESSSPLSGRDYTSIELYKCLSIEHRTHINLVAHLTGVPQEYLDVYIRRKSYLVYRMLHKAVKESQLKQNDLIGMIDDLKYDYAPQLRFYGDLPITYKVMRFAVLYFPATLSIFVIKMFVK